MSIDELIGALTQLKAQGAAGDLPVVTWGGGPPITDVRLHATAVLIVDAEHK